jgi:hypothetical protein
MERLFDRSIPDCFQTIGISGHFRTTLQLTISSQREENPEIAFSDPQHATKAMCSELIALDPAANGPPAHAESFCYLSQGEKLNGLQPASCSARA